VVATRPVSLDVVDGILAGLPGTYVAVAVGAERLVAGPTGLFLLAPPAADGLAATAARLARRAAEARVALARELAWVPFVDALVVADDDAAPGPATVVPSALLGRVLTEGSPILDAPTVERVGEAAAALWARMDGCSRPGPPDRATASSSPSTTWAVPAGRSSSPTPPASTAASGHRSPAG
jgi:hypothetical protein